MKHHFKNIFWLASKQILRDHIYTLAQFLLSLVFVISFFIKLFYFLLPEMSPEIRLKLSTDVLSTTVNILIIFSVVIFLLVSLIYNKNRNKTFGIMRGVGARKGFIYLLILVENSLILLVSSLLGLIFSGLIFNPSANYLERMYSITVVSDWNNFLFAMLITLGGIIVLSALSAFLTSLKILFTDPYEILRSRE
jgi:ABC-type antimicrobial peptide transport system permease subunit